MAAKILFVKIMVTPTTCELIFGEREKHFFAK